MPNWYHHLVNSKYNIMPLVQWYENMTSSRETEIHNISQCHQRRTKSRPQTTSTRKLAKFGYAVFELCEWTDRHTITLITICCTHPGGNVIINKTKWAQGKIFPYVMVSRESLGHNTEIKCKGTEEYRLQNCNLKYQRRQLFCFLAVWCLTKSLSAN